VLAQYGVEARQLTTVQAVRAGVNAVAAKAYEGAYYCDLMPERANAFIGSTPLPRTVQSASVASDADCNGDEVVSDWAFCASGQSESRGFAYRGTAANRLYQLVGKVSSVTITVTPARLAPDRVTVDETSTTSFQKNDAVVSQSSSWLYRRYDISGWHHMNVHSRENEVTIAADSQGGGLVDWRKR
jgi:hypothetical protein